MSHHFTTIAPLPRVAVAVILGMVAGHAWPAFQPWLWTTAGLTVLSLFLHRWATVQSVTIALLWAALGATLMTKAVQDMAVALPAQEVEYDAVLTSEPTVHGRVVMADLLILDGHDGMKAKASILRDTVDGRWRALRVGSGIHARSLLTVPANWRSGTFDYATYLREHGYRACTFIYKDRWQAAALDLSALSRVERTVLLAKRLRHDLLRRLGNPESGGQDFAVLAALTLGEKSWLDKDTRATYSVTGAAHVLALSGLHLGIIYNLLCFLLRGWHRRWAGVLLSTSLVWAFVVLVGFSPSVVRAATMLTIYAVVSLLRRTAMSVNTLALAAIIMLIIDPLTLYDMGFQLSFLAVLGILLFMPLIHPLVPLPWQQRHRAVAWLWTSVAMSLSAQMTIWPVMGYAFGQFSCYFLLSSPIVVLCAMALLYGIVLLVPLSLLPAAAHLLTEGLLLVVRFMNASLALIASLPGASINDITWTRTQTLALYALVTVVYLLWKRLARIRAESMYEG